MPPRKNPIRNTKPDTDDVSNESKPTDETKDENEKKEIIETEKKDVKEETKEDTKEEEKKEEIKESWDDGINEEKEHTDEEEIKDERRVYKIDDERTERRGRQKSIIDFDYREFTNISKKVNEMTTEDLIKYLIVRSHSEGQVPLCSALKFVLRGKNCEVSFDRMTSEPRSFNRNRGRGSDSRSFQRRPMRHEPRVERQFKPSSSFGRPKYDG